ncbi:hypothetical protein F4802DRAFT_289364 [Xylaria palmicola]|nr:hypothetical protein F4802DRAFT_289364 [Xylaria palmicola]
MTGQQYAALKAARRTAAGTRERDYVLRVFECGHLADALGRVRWRTPGPREKVRGLCGDCWRHIASDGRRRPGYRPGRGSRRLNESSRSMVDDKRYKRLRGRFTVGSILGPTKRRRNRR